MDSVTSMSHFNGFNNNLFQTSMYILLLLLLLLLVCSHIEISEHSNCRLVPY